MKNKNWIPATEPPKKPGVYDAKLDNGQETKVPYMTNRMGFKNWVCPHSITHWSKN